MKTQIFKLALLAFLCFQLVQAGSEKECEIKDKSSTLQVFPIYSPCSPFKPAKPISSWVDHVLELLIEDRNRNIFLNKKVGGGKKSSVPIAWGRNLFQTPNFVVRVNIGTPAQTFVMALDTSNDASWVPCSGCLGCSSTLFNTNKSSTFAPCLSPQCKQVPATTCTSGACTYNTTYGGSSISASLSTDNLTLATDTTPNYAFACLKKVTGSSVPPQGLLGLGRGPLSLLSQTQNLYKSVFSYCLPSLNSSSFSGSLRLGPIGQPIKILYTPLLSNPRRSSLYYVKLVGIRVGSKTVAIPPSAFAFNATTGAGTIIDSGTVYTSLVQAAYVAVRDEFRRVIAKRVANVTVSTLGGFDTCYTVPIVAPTITFVFQGYNMSLPQENILLRSSTRSLACLAMAAAPANVNSVLNVIASMQQQNFRIVFDVAKSRVGIARENCSK